MSLQRKHWIFVLLRVAVLALLGFAPLALGAITSFVPELVLSPSGVSFFLGAYSLWLLFLLIVAFYHWTVWVLDVWVVTDRKFVDIEQYGLFHRQVSTLTLEKVQDVTVEVTGLLATWLDFGRVTVQTAGQEREFVINGVRSPYAFKEKLLCACDEYKKAEGAKAADVSV